MSIIYESWFDTDSVGGVMIEVGRLVEDLVEDSHRLMIMVRELADNAVFHSGEGGGWCAVERSVHHLTIMIRDRGVGVRGSLRDLYPGIDERTAMQWVFGGGVSGLADPDRGLGLKMVLDYTGQGPTLLFESGGVAFVGVEGRGRVIGKSTQLVEGVIAGLRVPLRKKVAGQGDVAEPLRR